MWYPGGHEKFNSSGTSAAKFLSRGWLFLQLNRIQEEVADLKASRVTLIRMVILVFCQLLFMCLLCLLCFNFPCGRMDNFIEQYYFEA